MARVIGFALLLATATDDWSAGGTGFYYRSEVVCGSQRQWRRIGSVAAGADATGRHPGSHFRRLRSGSHILSSIRSNSFDLSRETEWALKLLLQLPGSLAAKLAAKGTVLLAGWVVSGVPALMAVALWKSYGGHLHAPETLNLLLGHFLRAMLSIGIAVAAAALTESAASAAIVTLGFTVGTWALDFIAAGRGGVLQQLANYTPTAALRSFEQGLLRLSTTVVMLAIVFAAFALAAVWLNTGRTLRYRLLSTLALAAILVVVMFGAARLRTSWDLTENRCTLP